MNFLIIEYHQPGQPPLLRSHQVLDEHMPIELILLVNSENAVKIIANIESNNADFPHLLDKHCIIENGGRKISGTVIYSDLLCTEENTDIGPVKLATITIYPRTA